MKKMLIFIGRLLGLLTIFTAILSNIIADGFNMKEIKELMDIFPKAIEMIKSQEFTIFKYIIIISTHSHWIITMSIIWLIFLSFLKINKRKETANEDANE